MLRLRATVIGAGEAAQVLRRQAALLEAPPRSAIERIAADWRDRALPAVLRRGRPEWPPRAAVTQRIHGPGPPLQGSGKLAASFEVLRLSARGAEVGTRLGAIHELGGTTALGSIIPGKTIPRRPFVLLADEAQERAMAVLREHYFGGR